MFWLALPRQYLRADLLEAGNATAFLGPSSLATMEGIGEDDAGSQRFFAFVVHSASFNCRVQQRDGCPFLVVIQAWGERLTFYSTEEAHSAKALLDRCSTRQNAGQLVEMSSHPPAISTPQSALESQLAGFLLTSAPEILLRALAGIVGPSRRKAKSPSSALLGGVSRALGRIPRVYASHHYALIRPCDQCLPAFITFTHYTSVSLVTSLYELPATAGPVWLASSPASVTGSSMSAALFSFMWTTRLLYGLAG